MTLEPHYHAQADVSKTAGRFKLSPPLEWSLAVVVGSVYETLIVILVLVRPGHWGVVHLSSYLTRHFVTDSERTSFRLLILGFRRMNCRPLHCGGLQRVTYGGRALTVVCERSSLTSLLVMKSRLRSLDSYNVSSLNSSSTPAGKLLDNVVERS